MRINKIEHPSQKANPSKNKSHPLLVFISGSMNSGKTTTSSLLAKKIGATFINIDDLRDTIAEFNIETDFPKVITLASETINNHLADGRDVVANYVLTQNDYNRLTKELQTKDQYFITLAPKLEIIQTQRGDRELSEWEMQRIKHHYNIGIASPKFGYIVDNSNLTVEETVDQIMEIIGQSLKL
jgi:2-phosphoglycerate kinase